MYFLRKFFKKTHCYSTPSPTAHKFFFLTFESLIQCITRGLRSRCFAPETLLPLSKNFDFFALKLSVAQNSKALALLYARNTFCSFQNLDFFAWKLSVAQNHSGVALRQKPFLVYPKPRFFCVETQRCSKPLGLASWFFTTPRFNAKKYRSFTTGRCVPEAWRTHRRTQTKIGTCAYKSVGLEGCARVALRQKHFLLFPKP